jgi:hypothetical protein
VASLARGPTAVLDEKIVMKPTMLNESSDHKASEHYFDALALTQL